MRRQFLVVETAETVAVLPAAAQVVQAVVSDEIVEVGTLQRAIARGEVRVGAGVTPRRTRPGHIRPSGWQCRRSDLVPAPERPPSPPGPGPAAALVSIPELTLRIRNGGPPNRKVAVLVSGTP